MTTVSVSLSGLADPRPSTHRREGISKKLPIEDARCHDLGMPDASLPGE